MTFTLTDTTLYTSTDSVALSYNGDTDKQIAQDVTMLYPSADSDYRLTRAIAPQGSKFQVGAHWHENYDEYMRVVQGRLRLRLGNSWKVYTPEDGVILIAKGVIHDLCRADKDAKPGEGDEGDMIIEEWSDPGTLFHLATVHSTYIKQLTDQKSSSSDTSSLPPPTNPFSAGSYHYSTCLCSCIQTHISR